MNAAQEMMTDAALNARFSALIRKKHPYQPDRTRKERVVKLSKAEERELWECALEITRREAVAIRRKYPPKQLTLFLEVTA